MLDNLPNGNFMAVLGKPINHSKSPLIHNTAFEKLGLPYTYIPVEADAETIYDVVPQLREAGILGFNITMPGKKSAYEMCDETDRVSSIIGACNTIKVEDGMLCGFNTDARGFERSLLDIGFTLKGKKATLFGTGGAATAIFVCLCLSGASVVNVFARGGRNLDDFYEVTKNLYSDSVTHINIYKDCYEDKDIINEAIWGSDLIINATNVGMLDPDSSIISDFSEFNEDKVAYDVIYEPEETKFLREAKAKGAATLNGKSMLFYQAAEAFRIWTGKEMPEEIIDIL